MQIWRPGMLIGEYKRETEYAQEIMALHLFSASPAPFLDLVTSVLEQPALELKYALRAEFMRQEWKFYLSAPNERVSWVHT